MKILEKIKALLAKAASTNNAHEAETFAAKAHELMEKYQIDKDTLGDADEVGANEAYTTRSRSRTWQSHVVAATATYYGCKAIFSSSPSTKVTIVGRASSRITAMEMAPYFIQSVNRNAREMAKETGWDSYKCAKQIGLEFVVRLHELARANRQPTPATVAGKNALILLDQTDALVKEMFPFLGKAKASKFSTSSEARERAGSISLNSQMGGRSALRLT